MAERTADDAFRVRLADLSDLPHLQVVLDGAAGTVGAHVHGSSAAQLLTENHVYLGFLGEAPVGCVMATLDPPVVLHCLSVVVDKRNQGHAGSVLGEAILHLDETVAPLFYWAAVDPLLPSAEQRFAQLGFVRAEGNAQTLSGIRVMFRKAPVELESAGQNDEFEDQA